MYLPPASHKKGTRQGGLGKSKAAEKCGGGSGPHQGMELWPPVGGEALGGGGETLGGGGGPWGGGPGRRGGPWDEGEGSGRGEGTGVRLGFGEASHPSSYQNVFLNS